MQGALKCYFGCECPGLHDVCPSCLQGHPLFPEHLSCIRFMHWPSRALSPSFVLCLFKGYDERFHISLRFELLSYIIVLEPQICCNTASPPQIRSGSGDILRALAQQSWCTSSSTTKLPVWSCSLPTQFQSNMISSSG